MEPAKITMILPSPDARHCLYHDHRPAVRQVLLGGAWVKVCEQDLVTYRALPGTVVMTKMDRVVSAGPPVRAVVSPDRCPRCNSTFSHARWCPHDRSH